MKTGWKTSEFWMRIGVHVLSAAALYLGQQQQSPHVQVASMVITAVLSAVTASGYQAHRNELKVAEIKAAEKTVLPPFLSGNPPRGQHQ